MLLQNGLHTHLVMGRTHARPVDTFLLQYTKVNSPVPAMMDTKSTIDLSGQLLWTDILMVELDSCRDGRPSDVVREGRHRIVVRITKFSLYG